MLYTIYVALFASCYVLVLKGETIIRLKAGNLIEDSKANAGRITKMRAKESDRANDQLQSKRENARKKTNNVKVPTYMHLASI